MFAEGHEVTKIVAAAEDLRDYVVDGTIFTRSGLTTMGTETVALFPHLTGFVLLRPAFDAAHRLLIILYIGKTLIYTIFKPTNIIDIFM